MFPGLVEIPSAQRITWLSGSVSSSLGELWKLNQSWFLEGAGDLVSRL